MKNRIESNEWFPRLKEAYTELSMRLQRDKQKGEAVSATPQQPSPPQTSSPPQTEQQSPSHFPDTSSCRETKKMPSQADDKRQAAREVIDILHEISILLVRVIHVSSFRSSMRRSQQHLSKTFLRIILTVTSSRIPIWTGQSCLCVCP